MVRPLQAAPRAPHTTTTGGSLTRKDPIALAKQVALKRLRSRVRLEAAIRADLILNEILPEFEKEFNRRVAAGEPYELTSYDEWVVSQVDRRLPRAA